MDVGVQPNVMSGEINLHVHYYENGNLQLQDTKKVQQTLSLNKTPLELGEEVVHVIKDAEDSLQVIDCHHPTATHTYMLHLKELFGRIVHQHVSRNIERDASDHARYHFLPNFQSFTVNMCIVTQTKMDWSLHLHRTAKDLAKR